VVFFPSRFFDINGALSSRKQPLLALEAFARLARTAPDAHFVAALPPGFLGQDAEGAARQLVTETVDAAGIADKVHFINRAIAQRHMVHYYRAADVTLVPSCEGFGLVYLESMACAVPVVGVAEGAGTEVVGDAGIFVAGGTNAASRLGDALAILYRDGRRRTNCGEVGRRRYDSIFSGNGWSDKLERILTM
jgi:glycosyltransferase involved in cell wall biosynthesis